MMTLFNYRTLYLAALCLLVVSCNVQPLEMGKVESTKLVNYSQKGIEAELGVRIKNPNNFGIKIFEADLDVSINGTPMGKAKLLNKVKIPGNSNEVHTFRIKSEFKNVLSGALGSLLSIMTSKSLQVGVKGEVKGGNLLIRKKYPVELNERISIGN